MLKESGGFMMAQTKTKLLRYGPGRAHHPGTLLGGHVGLHIRGPALSLFKAVQSPTAFPCPVRSDPAKRIARKNGPLS